MNYYCINEGGGVNGGFHVIKPPLTTLRLKDICGQAKLYIRPIQGDIPLDCSDTDTHKEVINEVINFVLFIICT